MTTAPAARPLPLCCTTFNIDPVHLLLPHLMGADGQEFIDAHGIDSVVLRKLRFGAYLNPDGTVEVIHRCQQLQDDGRCGIYATRPQICRDHQCETRPDCAACHGHGLIYIEDARDVPQLPPPLAIEQEVPATLPNVPPKDEMEDANA